MDATDWNDQGKAEVWRQGWADVVNAALEQAGHAGRIDHRSYERQGVEQIFTVHLGVAAFQMEKHGIRTQRGDLNRQVEFDNKMLHQLRARIGKLQKELDELMVEAATSHSIPSNSFADMLTGILEKPEEATRRQRIKNLKTFARAIAFVQQHNITDMPGLRDKVVDMVESVRGISDRLKKIDRRLKTLDEHVRHADNYFEHQALHRQYRKLRPGKQVDFYERKRTGLALFEAAERYLKPVLNGRIDIPRKAWKAEAAKLTAERQGLFAEYSNLKEDVRDAEEIGRCVETVLRGEQRRQRGRTYEVER